MDFSVVLFIAVQQHLFCIKRGTQVPLFINTVSWIIYTRYSQSQIKQMVFQPHWDLTKLPVFNTNIWAGAASHPHNAQIRHSSNHIKHTSASLRGNQYHVHSKMRHSSNHIKHDIMPGYITPLHRNAIHSFICSMRFFKLAAMLLLSISWPGLVINLTTYQSRASGSVANHITRPYSQSHGPDPLVSSQPSISRARPCCQARATARFD